MAWIYVKQPLTEQDVDEIRIQLSVKDRKIESEPCCDFCGAHDIIWTYAASQTVTGEKLMHWRWVTCLECSVLIDEDDWNEIEMKLMGWLRVRFSAAPRSVLLTIVRMVIEDFFRYAERRRMP